MELFLKVFQMNYKLLQFWSLCLDFLLSRNNLFYFGTILSMQWRQSLPLTSSSSPQIPSLEGITSTSFSYILLKTFFHTHTFFSQIIIYRTHTSGLSFFFYTPGHDGHGSTPVYTHVYHYLIWLYRIPPYEYTIISLACLLSLDN